LTSVKKARENTATAVACSTSVASWSQ